MNGIEQINSSLYFSALQQGANETAREAKKKQIIETKKSNFFSSALKKNEELRSLAEAGLPQELAGLSLEAALIFLKDKVTMAGDALSQNFSAESFAQFRTAVSQFMKYVVKHNFEIDEHEVYSYRMKKKKSLVEIRIIDEKLNELTSAILANQSDRILLLKKAEEIQGLIVDMFAS